MGETFVGDGERGNAVTDLLLGWRIYHLDDTSFSSPMRKTATVDDNRFLRPDGANLPAFLYFLREKHQASYNLIVRTVQLAAPFFEDFRLESAQAQSPMTSSSSGGIRGLISISMYRRCRMGPFALSP